MTAIPLQFDPYEWEEHLDFSETAGMVEARWKAIGMSVVFPKLKERSAPSRAEVEKHTPQLHFHGHNGYSLGRYTELFMFPSATGILMDCDRPEFFSFKMGSVEGSFGQATPLSHLLFDAGHSDDYQGQFSSIVSLRLMGVAHEDAEVAGLNAILLIGKEHGVTLQPIRVGDFEWSDGEEAAPQELGPGDADKAPAQVALSGGFSELAPLRMLLSGRDESTPEVAFLQFYRVLEYFSILCNEEGHVHAGREVPLDAPVPARDPTARCKGREVDSRAALVRDRRWARPRDGEVRRPHRAIHDDRAEHCLV